MKKVSDLTGVWLDYWVGRADGLTPQLNLEGKYPNGRTVFCDYVDNGAGRIYSPSTNWSQGGPIIEKECIATHWNAFSNLWAAIPLGGEKHFGETILIAAMRCFVASKFGEEVDDSQANHD